MPNVLMDVVRSSFFIRADESVVDEEATMRRLICVLLTYALRVCCCRMMRESIALTASHVRNGAMVRVDMRM